VNFKGILDAKLLPKELLGNLTSFQQLKWIGHFSQTAGLPSRVYTVAAVSDA
jgi:hypothetical protein